MSCFLFSLSHDIHAHFTTSGLSFFIPMSTRRSFAGVPPLTSKCISLVIHPLTASDSSDDDAAEDSSDDEAAEDSSDDETEGSSDDEAAEAHNSSQ